MGSIQIKTGDGWKTVPIKQVPSDVKGIQVKTGGGWVDVKEVQIKTGNGWQTVAKKSG